MTNNVVVSYYNGLVDVDKHVTRPAGHYRVVMLRSVAAEIVEDLQEADEYCAFEPGSKAYELLQRARRNMREGRHTKLP